MGFFSGVRRRIKKLIPKEVRPFIPYAAAMIPGLQAMGPLSGIGSMAARKALIAGGTKFLTDDEADLKDIARTSALAAAPDFLSDQMQMGANRLNLAQTGSNVSKTADALEKGSQYIKGIGGLKTVGAQGGIDYGIKAAELNEDALAEYNRMMAEQGINDKAGRRAAIRAIYSNTGTWDMDEVDSMLDTYGYRTGGRVGYAEGDMVLPMPSQISPERQNQIEGSQIAEQAYNEIMEKFINKFPGLATGEETLEEMIAMLQAEDVMEYAPEMGILGLDRSMDMITPQSAGRSAQRIMRGDTRFGSPEFKKGGKVKDEDDEDEGFNMEKFNEGFEYAKEGLDSLEALEDKYKPMPIRELRLQDGGSVDDRLMERVKELQDEGLDFASALAQAMKESMASGKSRGGIMDGIDVNMRETIDTPMGNETVDVNSMEEIKGQTAGPDWYMDRLEHLEFLGYNYETAGEIAYDTDRYMKVIEMDIAPGPGEGNDDYARGGRVGRAEGGMMAGADSSLMDAYEIYKFDMMEQGLEPMSIEQFRDQAMAEGKMANMDYREFIYDASRDNFANDMFGKDYGDLNEQETEEVDAIIEMELGKNQAAPERTMAASGGLMNLGGREMDLRGGGFVPMGAKERADDVPARLSKNEFVMTADAVRAAGGGSVQKGADLMYDQMKQLERQA